MPLKIYRLLAAISLPFIGFYALVRVFRGKEQCGRLKERLGFASSPRPDGPLIWCHAASVGELNAALTLIRAIDNSQPDSHLTWLVTTGTLTSANLFVKKSAQFAEEDEADPTQLYHIHQFLPWDMDGAINRFLTYWTPDAVLWLESELWPNTLACIRKKGLAAALINARLSNRSYQRWSRHPESFQKLMQTFSLVAAGSKDDQERLLKLGIEANCYGNLKESRRPEPEQPEITNKISTLLNERNCWIAASIHPDEFADVCLAHQRVTSASPTLLLAVPRHPERSSAFERTATAAGLSTVRLSEIKDRSGNLPIKALPNSLPDCIIVDSIGLMDTIYRQGKIVFMGGSLCPHGGQNPLEPAHLNSAILYGPHVENFANIYRRLTKIGGAKMIGTPDDLADAIATLQKDKQVLEEMMAASQNIAQEGQAVATRYISALEVQLSALKPPYIGIAQSQKL